MPRPALRCSGPASRRQFLKIGALSLGSVGLGGLLPLRLEAKGTGQDSDHAVILVWLPGGPPHMETYDMKPDAPEEYRGDFRPIRTNVPGIDVCELLPLHARIADKFTLIRSIAHNFADHGGGHKRFLTGRDPRSPVGFVNDYPMVGSMVARSAQDCAAGACPTTSPAPTAAGTASTSTASARPTSGQPTHPFTVVGDPSAPTFQVQNLSLAPAQADRLDDAPAAAPAPRHDAGRPRPQRHDGGHGRLRAAGPAAGDHRRRPPGLRPVAGAGQAARALRHARLGPARADGPAAGRARGQLRHDGAGEPVPVGPAVPRRTAPTTGTRTRSTATSSTTRRLGCRCTTGP